MSLKPKNNLALWEGMLLGQGRMLRIKSDKHGEEWPRGPLEFRPTEGKGKGQRGFQAEAHNLAEPDSESQTG